MADLFANLDRVQYICSCGQLAPLNYQYFCRHCLEIKCQECVFSLPDFIFCPNCFESTPGSDLKTRKYHCSHCFKCPRCSSVLSVQQYLVSSGEQEEGSQEQEKTSGADKESKSTRGGGPKAYYLKCMYCQWTTREADIPDGASPLDFKQPVDKNKERVQQLIDHYKQLALVDRVERDKRRKAAKRHIKPYSSLLDPSRSPKLSGLSGRPSGEVLMVAPDAVSAEASEDVEGVPEDLYTQPLTLENITTVDQRLADPSRQPVLTSDFWPLPFPLTGKRLRRCGKCDHILCKSEYNPNSVRYKIQQIARFTVPQVRIKTLPPLDTDKEAEFVLSVTNPTSTGLNVSFSAVEEAEVTKTFPDTFLKVSLPEGEFCVSAADDVGDMLETSEEEIDPEAAKFIVDKAPGEVHLQFSVSPPFPERASCKFLSSLHFTWTTPDSPPEVKNLQTTVVVDVGPL